LRLSYTYSAKYYENQPYNSSSHWDQTHDFEASLEHAFNERYKVGVNDSFVIGQEPDMLRNGPTIETAQRISGDNIRNNGSIVLDGQLTREAGFELGYDNALFDYHDTKEITDTNTGNVFASTGGELNRIENGAHLDGRWTLSPETIGVTGFRFRDTSYTGDQNIGGNVGHPGSVVRSDDRNNRLFSPYLGLDHTFRPDLTGSVRAGASYADYYNDPAQSGSWSPYVMASLKYLYAQESSLEIGFSHDRNSTDELGLQTTTKGGVTSTEFTADSESSVIFATLNHRFTQRFFGTLNAQFQNSAFNGGLYDNQDEQYYLVGLDLEYRFTPNFSAHTGYNYDKLESSSVAQRSFDRNRVYLGVTASY
jgi:hypothetical protein